MSSSDKSRLARCGLLLRRIRRRIFVWIVDHGHHLLPLAAAAASMATMWILIGPVLNRSGDDLYHVLNEYAIAHGIAAGDNPFGPLGMEFGQPVLRFYQALFYLNTVGWHLLAGLDIRFVHNTTIVICFALSPFAYAYFLRKLGFGRWTAGVGGLLSMISVAAFGNSFEAYFEAGIVTQSIGGLFLPWFMGSFIGMLRGENRAPTTAFLFAVAFLSHAIMSVFAVFAGALYVVVTDFSLRRNVKRLAVFAVLGGAMIAFWALPFVEHTTTMRPVPDSIIRGRGVHWFTSVSRSELAMVVGTGRLLDDPPQNGDARNENDKFMDKISIIGTLKTRPPVFTILTAFGVLVALAGVRRTSRRFLLAGFAFSLMLFAGPDDFRWLKYLPFIQQIQTFRCTYLVEFFAFGLAALGIGAIGKAAYDFITTRRRLLLKIPAIALFCLAFAGGLGWTCTEIVLLGFAHVNIRETPSLDEVADSASSLPHRGYPYRIGAIYSAGITSKIRQAWLAVYGFSPYCTHWKGTGPTAAYHLCTGLPGPARAGALYSLLGVRWFSGTGKEIDPLLKAKDAAGVPALDRWPSGKSRHTKRMSSIVLLDGGHDHFLRPLVGRPLPVVCGDDQWIWLTKSWVAKYKANLWDERTPIPMRVPGGTLEASGLLGASKAILYLDHAQVGRDAEFLRRVADRVRVVSSAPIHGVAIVPTGGKSVWTLLPEEYRPASAGGQVDDREELDPGLEVSEVRMRNLHKRSFQQFVFDVDNLRPVVAVLPMESVPGWGATLDGKPLPSFATGPDMVGVHVPAGAHRLEFVWRMPTRHLLSLLASLTALAIVLGLWIGGAARAVARGRVRR
jgi:hypothetical protein